MTARKSSLEDGGPAYPCTNEQFASGAAAPGMSLRDWFAGQIMSAFCVRDRVGSTDVGPAVEHAYRIADAMLKERAQ